MAEYIIDNSVTSPTEVYTYTNIHYPNGFRSSIVINDKSTDDDVKLQQSETSPFYSTISTHFTDDIERKLSLVITPISHEEPVSIAKNGLSIDYKITDLEIENNPHILIVAENLPEDYIVNIRGPRDNIVCHFESESSVCSALTYEAYNLKVQILKNGFLGFKSEVASFPVTGLNGHKLILNFSSLTQ